MGLLPRAALLGGGGVSDHEALSGRRGAGADGQAWHLSTEERGQLAEIIEGGGGGGTALGAAFHLAGDGEAADFTFAHGLGSLDVVHELYEDATGRTVYAAFERLDEDQVRVSLGAPLAVGEALTLVVLRAGENGEGGGSGGGEGGEGGGNFDGVHNDLDGLQGGAAGERYHLSRLGSEAAEDIAERRPQKPVNLSPEDGEADVAGAVTLTSSPYFNAWGMAMYGLRAVVYDGDGAVVHDSGAVETSLPEYRVPDGVLLPGAMGYTWRMAHVGANMIQSLFSDPTGFVTAEAWPEQYIDRPKMLIPAAGQIMNGDRAALMLSPFSGGGGVVQGPSDFRIAADPQMTQIVEAGSADGDLFRGTVALPRGQLLYADGRQTSEVPVPGVKSKWSFPVSFAVRAPYRGQRIGLVCVDEANLLFERMDGDWNPVALDAGYWSHNLFWAGWQASLNMADGVPQWTDIDGQKMVVVPKIWIKSGRIEGGPYAGMRGWMIDPSEPTVEEQAEGWHVHPAFWNPEGGEDDSLAVSAYLLQVAGGKAVSLPMEGTSAPPFLEMSTWNDYVEARNSDPANALTRGWKPLHIAAWSLFTLAAFIEYGGPTQFKNAVVDQSTHRNALGYRGIKLWNCGAPSSTQNLTYNYPVGIHGLWNKRAMLPRLNGTLELPRTVFPTEGAVAPGATGAIILKAWKIDGFMTTEDGVSPALRFDDYLVPKGASPAVEVGWGTESGLVQVGNGPTHTVSDDAQLGMPLADYFTPKPRCAYGVGQGGFSPNDQNLNDAQYYAMMVKYS